MPFSTSAATIRDMWKGARRDSCIRAAVIAVAVEAIPGRNNERRKVALVCIRAMPRIILVIFCGHTGEKG